MKKKRKKYLQASLDAILLRDCLGERAGRRDGEVGVVCGERLWRIELPRPLPRPANTYVSQD